VVEEGPTIFRRRAYTLPPATALWCKHSRLSLQIKGRFFVQRDVNRKRSDRINERREARVKIAKGVIEVIYQNQDIRNMCCQKWQHGLSACRLQKTKR
jgi:hypothetical protein